MEKTVLLVARVTAVALAEIPHNEPTKIQLCLSLRITQVRSEFNSVRLHWSKTGIFSELTLEQLWAG